MFRALFLAGLVEAYLLRRNKLGWVALIPTIISGTMVLVSNLRGAPGSYLSANRRIYRTKFPIQLPPLTNMLKVIQNKFGSKISLAATFGTISLAQLVAVHYIAKPLANRNVPVLSGAVRGVIHQVGRCPVALPIATLLAISALFTYVSARKPKK